MIPNDDFGIVPLDIKYEIHDLYTWPEFESMFEYESIKSLFYV